MARKGLTPQELGNKRIMDYRKMRAQSLEKDMKKPILETDERSEYASLRWDKEKGYLNEQRKIKRFEELKQKFEVK